jgi:hypothetical protein
MKTNIRPLLLIALTLANFCLASCGSESTISPVRPRNVPPDAWWSGGPDGGAWIQVRKVRENDFTAKIFDDGGSVWVAGQFIASTKITQPLNKDWLRKNIIGFDGRQIFVRNQNWTFKLATKDEKY